MVIAIDYDGTIGDSNREKVKWIATHLGVVLSPWQCDMTHCVPLIGSGAYKRAGDHVYERECTLQAGEVPGALAALRVLARRARLHVVTARPERRLAYAREWLDAHGALPSLAGIHSSHGSSKAAVCAAIGADVLIDDDPRHLLGIDRHGLCRILLQDGRQESPDAGAGIHCCGSWPEVVACVEAISREVQADL